jgi:hypothetical protein
MHASCEFSIMGVEETVADGDGFLRECCVSAVVSVVVQASALTSWPEKNVFKRK